MSELFNKAKHDAFKGDYLTRLLYLNVAVFILFTLTNAFTTLFTGSFELIPHLADDLLALPSDPWKLLLRPWTVLTYMFTHFGFRHILFNMIVLYFSGKILLEYLGEKRLLALYIYGGVGGGLLYILLSKRLHVYFVVNFKKLPNKQVYLFYSFYCYTEFPTKKQSLVPRLMTPTPN